MSIKQTDFTKFIEQVSKTYAIDKGALLTLASEMSVVNPFASKAAREYAELHEIDITKIKIATDRVTMNDLKTARGLAKTSDMFTAKARELARENDLTEADFSDSERTGKPRKSGAIQITVADVKTKLGMDSPKASTPNASPRAIEIADANGIDISQINGSGAKGRVLLSDIKDYIVNNPDESPDSDDESPDSDDESPDAKESLEDTDSDDESPDAKENSEE